MNKVALAAAGLVVVLGEATAWAGIDLRIICMPCDDEADCGDASDLCLAYPGVGNFCGMHCLTDDDCYGLSCMQTEVPMLNQCVDVANYCRGGQPFECALAGHCQHGQDCVGGHCVDLSQPLGGECSTDVDCAEGTCRSTSGGRVCTVECDWRQPVGGVCPAGLFCDSDDRCTLGLCAPGVAGAVAAGGACESPLDCQSLFCAVSESGDASTCEAPCDPAGATCPAGSHCEDANGSCGTCQPDCQEGACPSGQACVMGTCREPQPDGAACADENDCRSGVCAAGLCGGGRDDDAGIDDDGGLDSARFGSGCGCSSPASALVSVLLDLVFSL